MSKPSANLYPKLFSEIRIGQSTLRNRVVQSALYAVSSKDGVVTQRLVDLYANRARGGVAMIVTEALSGHATPQAAARIAAHDERSLEGLKRWADAVETPGCRLVGQLSDSGRGRHYPGRSLAAFSASALPDDLSWTVPHAMSADEVQRLIDDYVQTTLRLQRAGFSGVELHCGHGHLIHQFLSPQSNRRDDRFGGDFDRRMQLMRTLCSGIRSACGKDFILGLKLVGDDGVPGGIGPDISERIVASLGRDKAVDYLAMVQGAHHRSLEMHIPDRTYPVLPYRHITQRMRQVADGIPILAVGRVTTPAEAESLLEAGDCDAVMMGRAMLADAAWVVKSREGREDAIRLCINCNTCWEQIVDHKPVACDVNPRLGTADELGWTPDPAAHRLKVVIVGAGVAGLEAAWVAARRGHDVTVFGASPGVGGKAALNAAIPGCEQIARIHDFQYRAAIEGRVAFRLGRRARLDDVLALEPDVVVLATGSRMTPPEGLAPSTRACRNLRETVSALLAEGDQGKHSGTAVLYDHDHTVGTYDAAELLNDRYDRCVIITPREGIARDVALVLRQRIYRRMAERRIEIILLSEITDFAEGRISYRNVYNGETRVIGDVALLSYATPRQPETELAEPLRAQNIEVRLVGDCYAPRFVLSAVAEGHAAGNDI